MRSEEKGDRALFVALGCFAVVVALWLYLRFTGGFPGDAAAASAVRRHPATGSRQQILEFFSLAGTPSVAIATVSVAAAVVWRSVGRAEAMWLVAASGAVVVNSVVRVLLGPTPTSVAFFGTPIESYPSGHVVYASAVFGYLAVLAWRAPRGDVAAAALGGFAVAMGPARVLSGAHLPSDVLGGWLLGIGWLFLLHWAKSRQGDRGQRDGGLSG